MYFLTDLCSLCLANNKTIISILSRDNDGIVVKNKLEYALSEVINYKPEILKNICIDCLKGLNYVYKFKQKCLQNVMSLNHYIETMTVENKEFDYFVSTSGEVQNQMTTGQHFLANNPLQRNDKMMETNNSHSLCEIQYENNALKSVVKEEPQDTYDDSEMQCNTSVFDETCTETVTNINDTPVSNKECNLLSTNSPIEHPLALCEKQIPENNVKTEIILKNEPEYIHDEIDIKCDPLLSEEEDSTDILPNETTNNSEDSAALQSLLPVKSKERYESAYQQFENFCKANKVKIIKEDILLAYFEEKSQVLKSSSLWSLYSKLRTTLSVKRNIDIKKFVGLVAFIKKKAIGHQSKTSSVLTKLDIERFLKEADDATYLMMKVVLIVGISGACGRDELTNLQLKNIRDMGSHILIEMPHSTKGNERRQFTITSGRIEGLDLLQTFRKYCCLRPASMAGDTRFFVGYRNGKCIKQYVGMHSIGGVPRRIAEFLKLPNPCDFTGQCFRRSSAAVLAAAGADIVTVKRLGAWK